MAIHEVEDIFVCYAEDTIDRVVKDLGAQSSSLSEKQVKMKKSQKLSLKKNFAISVSLLMNDIQNFANLYRAFRDANPDYFDYEDGSSNDSKQSKDSNGEVYVPVVPALSDAFCSL
jgi:hypothetical protein